jgi:uncharacterized protein YciI
MPYFVAFQLDHPPHRMALRDQVRPEHRAYVKANDGQIRFAGAFQDDDGNQCGSVLVFECDHADDVWAWIKAEPFYRAGAIGEVHVLKWNMARNILPSLDWSL